MRLSAAALCAVVMTAGPAAAEALPPAVDEVVWCSSAMYWLATDAFDAGKNEEGAQYEEWSDRLAGQGAVLLRGAGRNEADIAAILDDSANAVAAELGTPAARYDVTACPDLVESETP